MSRETKARRFEKEKKGKNEHHLMKIGSKKHEESGTDEAVSLARIFLSRKSNEAKYCLARQTA